MSTLQGQKGTWAIAWIEDALATSYLHDVILPLQKA
jgi:hypothetical protein